MAGNVLAELFVKVGADTKGLKTGLAGAEQQMGGFAGRIQQHSKAIGAGMMVMGAAITGAFALSMKTAADFESGMREVNTMMGLSQEEFSAFSTEVQNLSAELGVNAVESTQALYQAISAGVPKENAIDFLTIAAKAAIGGVTDTETAVDGLTTVLNAFKMPMSEAGHVADIMFTTVKGGKTTMEELSASMFNVAPMAAALGLSFEDVMAATATLTKQGVPTSEAMTQIRSSMVALTKPTAEMEELLKKMGFESGQAALQTLGYAGTMAALRDAADNNNTVLATALGRVEGLNALLGVTGANAEMAAADLDAMANSTGAAEAAFAEMELSTSRQMEKLKTSFMDMAISVGNVLLPILTDIVDKIKPIVEGIKNWMEAHPGLTKVIIIATAVIGALMIPLGMLLMILPGLTIAMGSFGASVNLAIWPITLIVAAIAAAIAIGILLWKNWDTISEKCVEIWNNIKDFFIGIWEGIVDIFKEHWQLILAILFPAIGLPLLIARNWDKIKDFIKNLWAKVKDIIRDWVENIKQWLITNMNPWNWIKAAWDKLREGIKSVLNMIFGGSDVENWTAGLRNYLGSQDLSAEGSAMFSTFREGVADELGKTVGLVGDAVDAMFGTEAYLAGLEPSEYEAALDEIFGLGSPGVRAQYEAYKAQGMSGGAARGAISMAGQLATVRAAGYQHGGIVTRPTLAMLGEREAEAVIPLSKMGGGIVINFTEPVFFDREDTMNKFIAKIRQGINRADRLNFGGAYSGG